jgi:lactoylglutathione lyase
MDGRDAAGERFTELFPIVSTTDMARALSFYRDLLGGTVTFEYPGPDGAPAYVGMDIGSSHIGIGVDPDGGHEQAAAGRRSITLWVYADDCDAAIDHLRRAEVTIVAEPADQPWGERMARVHDPDRNEVIVASKEATGS